MQIYFKGRNFGDFTGNLLFFYLKLTNLTEYRWRSVFRDYRFFKNSESVKNIVFVEDLDEYGKIFEITGALTKVTMVFNFLKSLQNHKNIFLLKINCNIVCIFSSFIEFTLFYALTVF